jgi:hypothetical protein
VTGRPRDAAFPLVSLQEVAVRAPTLQNSLAAVLAAAGLCAPLAAHAGQPLPDAVFGATLGTFNTSQSYSAAGTYSLGNLTTTVTGLPGASLTGQAKGTDLNVVNGNGSLESSIVYSYGLDGAPAGVVVPMFVSFTLQTSSSGGPAFQDDASARFVLNNGAFDVFNVLAASSDPIAHPNFSGTLGFSQLSDAVGRISLQIDVRAIGGGVADAFIDPYVFIDPDFLALHPDYAVIVSPGVGNTAPGGAPEPAAWVLMALGFGGLGAVLRSRRRAGRQLAS